MVEMNRKVLPFSFLSRPFSLHPLDWMTDTCMYLFVSFDNTLLKNNNTLYSIFHKVITCIKVTRDCNLWTTHRLASTLVWKLQAIIMLLTSISKLIKLLLNCITIWIIILYNYINYINPIDYAKKLWQNFLRNINYHWSGRVVRHVW